MARRRKVLKKHRTICHICGNPGGTEVDHVVPLAEGGADEEENMRPVHTDCHAVKSKEERERGLRRSFR